MSTYSIEVKKEGDRDFHAIWDQIRNGYVPIFPVGFDINGAIGKRSVATVMNSMQLLHVPHASYKKRLPVTSIWNIEQCSKLHFLMSLLDEIRNAKCPITIAIVTSTAEREVLFSQALEVYQLRHNYAFSKLHSQGKTKSPLYGVRVQFATKESLEKANDVLTVDYVIVYDSSLIPHRNDILSDFKGITYEKPGIISLVSLHTPDIRLCNYRDAHPDLFTDPHVKIKSLPLAEAKFFNNISYKRASKDQRVNSNKEMVKKVKNWMFLNNQTIFKPLSIQYPQVNTFQTNPENPTKQSTDNDSDSDSTDNGTDNENENNNDTKQSNAPDCKNTSTASCAVNPTETTQKRIQPNSGNDSPKKQKTGKGNGKDGTKLHHIITLDDSSDDDTAMTDGGIHDPIEIISSDTMSDTSDDASSEDEIEQDESDELDELDVSSSDESMSSTIDTTPIPEPNTTSKPAPSATPKNNGDVVMAEKEDSAIKMIEESGKPANEVVNGTSANKTIERISVKETMEIDMVKSARPQSALAKSLSAFQMELDQLHAEFVRRISQN